MKIEDEPRDNAKQQQQQQQQKSESESTRVEDECQQSRLQKDLQQDENDNEDECVTHNMPGAIGDKRVDEHREEDTESTKLLMESGGEDKVGDNAAGVITAVAKVLRHGSVFIENQHPQLVTQVSEKSEQKKSPSPMMKKVLEPTWKTVLRGAAPHLGLLAISIIYTFVGAAVFIRLEEPRLRELRKNRTIQIRENRERLLDNLYALSRAGRPIEEGEKEFQKFALTLKSLHQSGNWREEDGGTSIEEWNFGAAVFFVLTTLTTIGYGNVVPATQPGRIFFIFYGLIGVPLLLVTTADFAKFMSSGLTRLYVNYLKWKARFKEQLRRLLFRRTSASLDVDDTESMAEYVWNNVDSVHYVKIHAPIILIIIITYTSIGGWLFSLYEPWSFFDAFYFSFISILKVGFGDLLPSNQRYSWLSLLYIFFGLMVATMCVDIAGSQYLERIHQLGRQMKDADYLRVIQRAKYRRKRKEAMKSLMTLLTLVNRMKIPPGTLLRKEMEELKMPPPPPHEVYVTNITPYSIKLLWTPPASPGKAKYVLKYRMKHSKSESTVNISSISDGEFEIKNLKSFSIYEISLASVNRVGRSNSVRLIQITEPESSPQDLAVELLGPASVRLTWKPPYKKRKDVKKYAIYYSKDPAQPFERWTKVMVESTDFSLKLDDLDDGADQYAFCISSVYDRGHSPISRSVYACGQPTSRKTSCATAASGFLLSASTATIPEGMSGSATTLGQTSSNASDTRVLMDVPL